MILPAYSYPDRHEAKDLRGLLDRMDDPLRLKWLNGVCQKASEPGAQVVVITVPPDARGYLADLWTLAHVPGLVEWATGWAEWLVAGKDVREMLARPLQ